jgi:hypothetical protein
VRVTKSAARCEGGSPELVEQFAGRLRDGDGRIGDVLVVLRACPGIQPTVLAGVTHDHAEPYSQEPFHRTAVQLRTIENPDSFTDGNAYGTGSSYHSEDVTGSMFRRNTGMSATSAGNWFFCSSTYSNGTCYYGSPIGPHSVRVDSSISGHWARLTFAADAEPGNGYEDQPNPQLDRTVRVTSQPYGNGGWKVTRVA